MEPIKVFIVEDESIVREGIRDMIPWEQDGFVFFGEASDGEVALPMVRRIRPDILITDIKMPFMDGLSLSRLVNRELPDTRIIILSGYNDFDYAKTAIGLGVTDYLLKPVDSEQLFAQLYRIYEQLPKSYQQIHPAAFPHLPFFEKNIHDPSYPASLKRTVIYIEQNYMKELTLQDIACEMMLSPNYLSSLINTHLGHSFNYLLDYIRLEKALLLIASEPDMTNAELSYLVGYSSERRLYHAFQTRLGFTPGWYRDICLTRRRSNHDGNT